MIAIETHRLPASGKKGARIVARGGGDFGRLVVSVSELKSDTDLGQHQEVAEALCNIYGWLAEDEWLAGGKTHKGYAFVFVKERPQ